MDISLSLIEVLAFAGLFQCVSILVYLGFRAGKISLALIPLLFFTNLAAALYLDFTDSFFAGNYSTISDLRFWIWMLACPLSILLVLQCADLSRALPPSYYLITLPVLLPLGLYFGVLKSQNWFEADYMYLMGALGATISLSFLWLKSRQLNDIKREVAGTERYWMIIALISITIGMIGLVYTLLAGQIEISEYKTIRTIFGLIFVYLSATYLFRIYPPPIKSITTPAKSDVFSPDDEEKIKEIEHKLEYEKVYLEPAYSRSDMAQELKISESHLSRLINQHYAKSYPMILNSYRVREACQLLEETDAPIKVVSEEVGFNSLASFNRVFREETGETASSYRQKKVKEASRKIA